MKNYYEILEVDINASPEMIDKAYKLLAKKYHPDTQSDEQKKIWAEEQFKILSEAYETLSNKEKRKEYTEQLEYEKNSKFDALTLENENLKNLVNELQNKLRLWESTHTNNDLYEDKNVQFQEPFRREEPSYTSNQKQYYQEYKEPIFYESYYHPIKSRLKSFISGLITIAIIIGILYLIWHIPFTRNLINNFIESNPILKNLLTSI